MAAFAARTADEAASPALLLTALAAGWSESQAALAVAAMAAATGLAGPLVGAVLDASRHPNRTVARSMAWMAGGLLVLAVSGSAPLPFLLAISALTGLAGPVLTGGWTAQLPQVLEPGRRDRGNLVDAATYNVAGIAGPALAGVLAGSFGARFGLLAAAAALLLVMPLAVSIPLGSDAGGRPVQPWSSRIRELMTDMRSASTVLVRNRALRQLTVITVVAHAGLGAALIATPLLATTLTGSGSAAGYLLAVFAGGGLGGTLLMARWPARHAPDHAVVLAAAIAGSSLLLCSQATSITMVAGLFAVAGAADGALLTATLAVRHREAPAHLRAQVFTTSASLKIAAYSAGLAACGAVADSGSSAVATAGLLQVVAAAAVVVPGLRATRPGPSRHDQQTVGAPR